MSAKVKPSYFWFVSVKEITLSYDSQQQNEHHPNNKSFYLSIYLSIKTWLQWNSFERSQKSHCFPVQSLQIYSFFCFIFGYVIILHFFMVILCLFAVIFVCFCSNFLFLWLFCVFLWSFGQHSGFFSCSTLDLTVQLMISISSNTLL